MINIFLRIDGCFDCGCISAIWDTHLLTRHLRRVTYRIWSDRYLCINPFHMAPWKLSCRQVFTSQALRSYYGKPAVAAVFTCCEWVVGRSTSVTSLRLFTFRCSFAVVCLFVLRPVFPPVYCRIFHLIDLARILFKSLFTWKNSGVSELINAMDLFTCFCLFRYISNGFVSQGRRSSG